MKKILNAGDQIHVITYALMSQTSPVLYITVPEAGVGLTIAGEYAQAVLFDESPADMFAAIAHTLLLGRPDDPAEEQAKTAALTASLNIGIAPLDMSKVGSDYTLACYTTCTMPYELHMEGWADAVILCPSQDSLGLVDAKAVDEDGTKHTIH